jgi:hypothetical protein
VWSLWSDPGQGGGRYCFGLITASQTNPTRLTLLQPRGRSTWEEAEFFVWIWGPYRSLGIGTAAVRQILQEIDAEAAFGHPAQNPLRRLTVYFPLEGGGPGSRLQLDRWMTFFIEQGFRRIRQSDTGLAAQFAILKRILN